MKPTSLWSKVLIGIRKSVLNSRYPRVFIVLSFSATKSGSKYTDHTFQKEGTLEGQQETPTLHSLSISHTCI